MIAWRYLRGERSRMLSTTALAAWAATALGVMAMVIAMALMTGYTEYQALGFDEEPPFPLLQKPFLPEDLLRQVQTVMQG